MTFWPLILLFISFTWLSNANWNAKSRWNAFGNRSSLGEEYRPIKNPIHNSRNYQHSCQKNLQINRSLTARKTTLTELLNSIEPYHPRRLNYHYLTQNRLDLPKPITNRRLNTLITNHSSSVLTLQLNRFKFGNFYSGMEKSKPNFYSKSQQIISLPGTKQFLGNVVRRNENNGKNNVKPLHHLAENYRRFTRKTPSKPLSYTRKSSEQTFQSVSQVSGSVSGSRFVLSKPVPKAAKELDLGTLLNSIESAKPRQLNLRYLLPKKNMIPHFRAQPLSNFAKAKNRTQTINLKPQLIRVTPNPRQIFTTKPQLNSAALQQKLRKIRCLRRSRINLMERREPSTIKLALLAANAANGAMKSSKYYFKRKTGGFKNKFGKLLGLKHKPLSIVRAYSKILKPNRFGKLQTSDFAPFSTISKLKHSDSSVNFLSKIRGSMESPELSTKSENIELLQPPNQLKPVRAEGLDFTPNTEDTDIIDIDLKPEILRSRIGANIQKPNIDFKLFGIRAEPNLLRSSIRPKLLSPVIDGKLLGVVLAPSGLNLTIEPEALSPLVDLKLADFDLSSRMLTEIIKPSLLSPKFRLKLFSLDIAGELLTQSILPCLLGADIRVHLIDVQIAPKLLTQQISPSVLCPRLRFNVIKIPLEKLNGRLFSQTINPSVLSPNQEINLITIGKQKDEGKMTSAEESP